MELPYHETPSKSILPATKMVVYMQLDLFSSSEEAEFYHDTSRHGFFSLLVSASNGRKKQDSYRLSQMPLVLETLDVNRDTWLSQAEFLKPNRRIVNLARIGLLFVDIDTYREDWATGLSPEQQVNEVLFFCSEEGIPAPSLLVFSGRGLQAKWLLEGTIPRQALPRWNACQRHLVNKLSFLGADPRAKDASRVLRLINTVNSRSKEICRVVHVENTPGRSDSPVQYSFEYLAECLLPLSRKEMEEQRKIKKKFKLIYGNRNCNLKAFSSRKLAWDRLEDLRFLANLRGGVADNQKTQHLFWCLNFLLLSGATNSRLMYYEAAALAKEVNPSWNYRSQELMSLYAKAKEYEAGEKVEYGGRTFPPLYTPKNDTLINLFKITDQEQQNLKTIISKDIARERHRKRERERRRKAGAVDREVYERESLSRQKPWKAIGISRAKWYRLGKPLPNND